MLIIMVYLFLLITRKKNRGKLHVLMYICELADDKNLILCLCVPVHIYVRIYSVTETFFGNYSGGSFHIKSTRSSDITILDFVENWHIFQTRKKIKIPKF